MQKKPLKSIKKKNSSGKHCCPFKSVLKFIEYYSRMVKMRKFLKIWHLVILFFTENQINMISSIFRKKCTLGWNHFIHTHPSFVLWLLSGVHSHKHFLSSIREKEMNRWEIKGAAEQRIWQNMQQFIGRWIKIWETSVERDYKNYS